MPRKTTRTHAQGDESRRRILDATLEIASRRGYDGTTVALVMEATGLPASSVYWHFRNKDELLAEVLEHSYRQWRDRAPSWDGPPAADLPRVELIHGQLRSVAGVLVAVPEFWRLGLMLSLEQRTPEPAARRRFLRLREESAARIGDWWRSLLGEDEIWAHPDVPGALARLTLAGMDGLFVAWQGEGALDIDRLVTGTARGLDAAATRLMTAPPVRSSATAQAGTGGIARPVGAEAAS